MEEETKVEAIVSSHCSVLAANSLSISRENVPAVVSSVRSNLQQLSKLIEEKDTPATVFEKKRADRILASALIDVCELYIACGVDPVHFRSRGSLKLMKRNSSREVRRRESGSTSDTSPKYGSSLKPTSISTGFPTSISTNSLGELQFPCFPAVEDSSQRSTPNALQLSDASSAHGVPYTMVQSMQLSGDCSPSVTLGARMRVSEHQLLKFIQTVEQLGTEDMTDEQFAELGITYAMPVFVSPVFGSPDAEPELEMENLIPGGSRMSVERRNFPFFKKLVYKKAEEILGRKLGDVAT